MKKIITLCSLLLFLPLFLHSLCYAAPEENDYSYIRLSPEDGYPSDVRYISVTNHYVLICTPSGAYRISNGAMDVMSTQAPIPYDLPDDNIYYALKDNDSNNWILSGGGVLFMKGNQGMQSKKMRLLDKDALAFTAISTEDATYFGGENCIWKYTFSSGEFSKVADFVTESEFNISNMVRFSEDRIFLLSTGTNSVYEFNTSTNEVSPINADLGSNFTASLIDSDGNLWLARSGEGLYCYDRNLTLLKSYSTSNSKLSNDQVLCMIEKDGQIWTGTYGGGLNIIDKNTGKIQILHNIDGDPNPFPNDFISSLGVDSIGNVWVGTCHGGVFLICKGGIHSFPFNTIRPELKHDGASTLFFDVKDNTYWCGFYGAGIIQYLPRTNENDAKRIIQYPETNGMSISSIAGFGKDYLIFSCSPEGVYKLDKKTGKLTTISIFKSRTDRHRYGDDGPILCNDTDGNIIGTSDRIYRYDPNSETIESWSLPEGTKGHMYPVFGAKGQYFFDNTTLYKWDDHASNKLVPLYTIDNDTFTCSSTGPNRTIWLSSMGGLHKYSLDTGDSEYIALPLDSELRSMMYVFRTNTIWIGTSKYLYNYNYDKKTVLRVDKSFGALETTYEAKAKMVDNSGNLFMAGRTGISLIREDDLKNLNSTNPPKLRVNNVNIDSKNVMDFSHLIIHPKYSNVDISFFPIDEIILRHKKFRFIINGPEPTGTTEYLKEEPEFHFKANLPAGQYTISGCCTDVDGSWTEMETLYSFYVEQVWYKTWWAAALVVLLIFLSFIIVQLLRKKYKAQENEVEKARMASEMKSLFVQNLSHDVRTPLNAIIGYSQLLAMPEGSLTEEEREEFIEYITTSSDMLIMLVDDVLNMSDIERGVYKVKKEKASCNEICNKSVKCCMTRVLPGVKLYYTPYMEGEDHMLYSDPKRIQQILVNFLTNACKHTDKGEIHVHYSLDERPGYVVFSVTDTGEGVPKDIAEDIFNRFTTLDANKGGHGLGLNICNTISQSLGGKVELDTSYTTGARFIFIIPDTPDEV